MQDVTVTLTRDEASCLLVRDPDIYTPTLYDRASAKMIAALEPVGGRTDDLEAAEAAAKGGPK